jgi:hypothetical protein
VIYLQGAIAGTRYRLFSEQWINFDSQVLYIILQNSGRKRTPAGISNVADNGLHGGLGAKSSPLLSMMRQLLRSPAVGFLGNTYWLALPPGIPPTLRSIFCRFANSMRSDNFATSTELFLAF